MGPLSRLVALLLVLAPLAAAQPSDATRAATEADHRRMMEMLGIEALRPGPSGNPTDSNAANADEAQAKTYGVLPDPLLTEDGWRVTEPSQWWRVRRPEIVELFDREVYGRLPDDVPAVTWEVRSEERGTDGGVATLTKTLAGRVDNSAYPSLEVAIDLTVVTPADAPGPVPVMIHYGWRLPPNSAWRPPPEPEPTWRQQLLQKGWGYAELIPTSVQADNGAGLAEGVIGLTNRGEPRAADDWGALRAWAWGASRAIDYLEADPDTDGSRVGIEGLSRYGKAALVAMAYEPRLAVGFIGSSGAGGAKLLRRDFGEQVENLASSAEYHWFAGSFLKYAGPLTKDDLPVDAHELIALAAPRPVFISVGAPDVEGQWIDARGMFEAGVHAGPVYRLLGAEGLGATIMPPLGTALVDGEVAFRQHEGGHTTIPNWPTFIEYAAPYIGGPDDQWLGTWGTAVQLTEPRNLPPVALAGTTLRQVVRPSVGGDRLRLHLSNAFGDAPILIGAVHLAASRGDGAIDPATDVALSFGGQPGVAIPPGGSVTSDPVAYELVAYADLAITMRIEAISDSVLTGHPGSRTTSYIVEGDVASAAAMPDAVRTDHWYVLEGLDVERDGTAVAIIGDSITDGRGSTTNAQNRWPDVLAARLGANPATNDVAVLNVGIGGNCVLRPCLGPSALDRFERDVLDRPGVEWLVVLEGVNDIGGSPPDRSADVAADLIEAYQQMIWRAHAQGIRVYGATITPFGGSFYGSPEHEAARQTVNEWIRTSGAFDAVIDLDAAVRDLEAPTTLLPAADDGDGLHPSAVGHRMMGEAVELSLFEASVPGSSTSD